MSLLEMDPHQKDVRNLDSSISEFASAVPSKEIHKKNWLMALRMREKATIAGFWENGLNRINSIGSAAWGKTAAA